MALKKLKKLYSTKTKKSSSSSSTTANLAKQASNLKTRLEASGVSTDSRTSLQKALNLREGSGFLEGLGDVLERGSGLASIKAMLVGDPLKSAGQNALDALLGNQRYTGVDVLTAANPEFKNASGISKFLGGLATDILLDPATYLSLGASALAKNATAAGAKALGYVDDAGRLANGLNLQGLSNTLKSTKTINQALDILPQASDAKKLLNASKLYRTADTLDTIANPLKLVPQGVKKAGKVAMKGVEKVNPKVAEGLTKMGGELKKTFDYASHLKSGLGDDVYREMKAAESVAEASMAATSKKSGEQYKILQKVLEGIKKDPDRIWTLTSKVDGSKSTFTFSGLTDDDIMKKLYEFANNEVYFERPTILAADTINNLVRNNGRAMIAAQDFADPKDLKTLEKALKTLAKDPDQVSIARYKQGVEDEMLNLYHGSKYEFDTFDLEKAKKNRTNVNLIDGHYFADNIDDAGDFGEYVYEVEVPKSKVTMSRPSDLNYTEGDKWYVVNNDKDIKIINKYKNDLSIDAKEIKEQIEAMYKKLARNKKTLGEEHPTWKPTWKENIKLENDNIVKEIEELENRLKQKYILTADSTNVSRYVQPETGKEMGWVINIGEENANALVDNLDSLYKRNATMKELVKSRTKQNKEVSLRRTILENKINDNTNKIAELESLSKQVDDAVEKMQEIWQEQHDILSSRKDGKLTKAAEKKLSKLRMEQQNLRKFYYANFQKTPKELLKAKRTANLLESNLRRMDETSVLRSNTLLKEAKAEARVARKTLTDALDVYRTRQLIPFESPIIDIPEMKDVARLQKEITDMNLGIRNLGGMDVNNLDVYDYYVHRKLTPESLQYIRKQNVKNNPVRAFLINATDKLPAQSALTNLYGNYSPVEVNIMMGFDLFDSNIVSSNLDMVTKLNRRSYNTQLTKALFTEPNDWVKDVAQLADADIDDLLTKGYEPISSTQVASKLKLNEILNDNDIRKITESLKDKNFLVNKDVLDLFDKNIKLYKQLDSEFYQQLSKYMKYWKGGNLLSVGYHLRNIVGAQTNMALAGMSLDDVARYTAQAGIDVGKYNTKLLPEFRKWLLDPSHATIFKTGTLDDVTRAFAEQVGMKDAKLFTEMLDAQIKGVWGGIVGQHDAVKRAIGEMPTSKIGQVADKVNDINYKLGATADDINRLASYRWAQNPNNYAQVAKVGAQDALDFVNYAMFDFKSMSPTEQAYFTKIFPFYNFIKNNLVFQFKNMTKNTQSYNTLSKAYKNLYSAQEITDDEIQQYVKDQLYIPIKQADGTIKILKVSAPVQDATNLLQLKNLLGATNPIIQYITDRAYGEDLYTGAELGDRTKNTQELLDILPYGRLGRTLLNDPFSALLPISSTTSEKGINQNAYAELERLEKLRNQYKKQTGQSLPTLEELGLR